MNEIKMYHIQINKKRIKVNTPGLNTTSMETRESVTH